MFTVAHACPQSSCSSGCSLNQHRDATAFQTRSDRVPMNYDDPNFLRFPKSICTFHGVTFAVDPRYVIRSHVGQGAQGVIWSAIDSLSAEQKEVAVKKVPNALDEVLASKRLLRELRVLRHLKHENIISLIDIMLPPSTNVLLWKDVYMVYELMDTDLDYVIKSGQEISDDHVQYFSSQLLTGISYLHKCNVVHRDLKASALHIAACPKRHAVRAAWHSARSLPARTKNACLPSPSASSVHAVARCSIPSAQMCVDRAATHLQPAPLLFACAPPSRCLRAFGNQLRQPGNILVDRNCRLVICDFGLARSCVKQARKRPAQN